MRAKVRKGGGQLACPAQFPFLHTASRIVLSTCANISEMRGLGVMNEKGHMCILAEVKQLDVKELIRDSIQFGDIYIDSPGCFQNESLHLCVRCPVEYQQELLQLACHQWARTPPIPAGAKRILYTTGNASREKGWWRTGTDKFAFHSLDKISQLVWIPKLR